MKQTKEICFDLAYSSAFIIAAVENGYAKFLVDEQNAPLLNAFLNKRAARRLQKKALEMAVIFEKLYLFGSDAYIDFSALKKEGFPYEIMGSLQTFSSEIPITPEFLQTVKHNVIRSIHRNINRKLKYTQKNAIPYLEVSRKYNSLISLATTEYSLHRLADNLFQTIGSITRNTLPENYKKLMPPVKLPYLDSNDRFVLSKVMNSFENFVIFSAIYEEVNSLWNSFLTSLSLAIPFLTNNPPKFALLPKFLLPNQYEMYLICQVALGDEIGYVPVIDSIDDVLRLRGNKYILNFREALWSWCNALKNGEKENVKKIRREIQIANRDLKQLKKWKRADKWIFWVETAASLVPVLNYMVVGETIIRHLYTNRLESRSGWLAFIM